MTVTLRISVRDDARAAILRDPELSRALDASALVIELDADDSRFHRILDVTRNTSGCWLNPIMRFTPAEMSQARYFQPDCRGKIVVESARDYELNSARVEEAGFHRAGGRPLRIKLIDRLAFSRITLPANAIGCATDWLAEFVVAAGVASVFERASLSGYALRPVLNPKTGKDYTDYFQLYSDSIMPAAEADATTSRVGEADGGGLRELGCLSYVLKGATVNDFNRTAEDWSNHSQPVWVVSARVRECVQAAKLKGWAFRPVLETGTPLHEAYMKLWSDLVTRMAVNPRNRF